MSIDPTILGTILFVALPFILVALRILFVREGVGLEDLFDRQTSASWPRGVQEDEPARWRTELARPRGLRGEDSSRTEPGAHTRRAKSPIAALSSPPDR